MEYNCNKYGTAEVWFNDEGRYFTNPPNRKKVNLKGPTTKFYKILEMENTTLCVGSSAECIVGTRSFTCRV